MMGVDGKKCVANLQREVSFLDLNMSKDLDD